MPVYGQEPHTELRLTRFRWQLGNQARGRAPLGCPRDTALVESKSLARIQLPATLLPRPDGSDDLQAQLLRTIRKLPTVARAEARDLTDSDRNRAQALALIKTDRARRAVELLLRPQPIMIDEACT